MRSQIERFKTKKAWLPCTGAALLGILVFSLSLEGSGVPGTVTDQERAISKSPSDLGQPRAVTSRVAHRNSTKASRSSFRVGVLPQREYPIGPVYQVDPQNDIGSRGRREGKWVGAMPAPTFGSGVIAAGGSCSFAIDCDDNDPCTTDSCDIAPGGGEGSF